MKAKIETGLTKNEIVATLAKSPHGKLEEYLAVGKIAAAKEPDFFSHLIAWNQVKGQIRDSKVALPVVALLEKSFTDPELVDNAWAHLASQSPRDFLRGVRFALGQKLSVNKLRKLITGYLRHREANWALWERTAVQHRKTLKELYALAHVKPSDTADAILFKGLLPRGSVFEVIAGLKNMDPAEAAGHIVEKRIPAMIAMGALGEKCKDPKIVQALIDRMSATELVTNSKMLEKMGVKTVPALRAAYEQALSRASSSKKTTFKATKAAESIEDEGFKRQLQDLQEKQIKAMGGVDGNWLVLGDKSGSMKACIEAARHVAATLAKVVKGEVHLVFFDTAPLYMNATGKTFEEITRESKRVQAEGGTSIGCGLQYCLDAKLDVDGIAVISDGGENRAPFFAATYEKYAKAFDKEPTVYFYHLPGEPDCFSVNLAAAKIDAQKIPLGTDVDYYSLPNLVSTMRVSRYSLADEIMNVPLLRLEEVLPGMAQKGVLIGA